MKSWWAMLVTVGVAAALLWTWARWFDPSLAQALACRSPSAVLTLVDWRHAALCGLWHWSGWHLAVNLAGLSLLARLSARLPMRVGDAVLAAVALPLLHLVLMVKVQALTQGDPASWQPLHWRYGGLSGWLHALWAYLCVVAFMSWAHRRRANHSDVDRRQALMLGCFLTTVLGAKMLMEAPWQPPLMRMTPSGFAVMPMAHGLGVLLGCLLGITRWPLCSCARALHRSDH